jgi:SAM-dependent methyltransferase
MGAARAPHPVIPSAHRAAGGAPLLAAFTLAIFSSAFLLFLIQPLFGRMALPLLGGSPAVWNTCMLFFQAALLGGYLYAHLTSTRLRLRSQAALHLGLLLAAALVLPVAVGRAAPAGDASPVPWLLVLMAGTVGPPFFVLSGTGPILQRWFSRSTHRFAGDPYPLYAASNLGSALALLLYPVAFEPALRIAEQSRVWAAGYGILVLLVASCALLVWRGGGGGAHHEVPAAPAPAPPPGWTERAAWVGLAFVPSSLFLSVTTFITTDLSPVPLLWVLPLALYLLSFTFVFARRPPLPHRWMVALGPSAIAVAVLLISTGYVERPSVAVPLHLVALFVIAMVAHGELARRRPHPDHLTAFYLWISVGGVAGGVFNALVAPAIFDHVWEYPATLVLASLARPWPERRPDVAGHLRGMLRAAVFAWALIQLAGAELSPLVFVVAAVVVINLLSILLGARPLYLALCILAVVGHRAWNTVHAPGVLLAERTFFGRYRVVQVGTIHALRHGSTLHGAQDLHPPSRREPMTYYLRRGPLGRVFEATGGRAARRRVAVVGLGTGSAAAYAREGEEWSFYEIDPGIVRIATDSTYFTYLLDTPAQVRIVVGDARLSLAGTDRSYDLIILDAFSSDAIPTHLLTLEALDTYLARLAPGGVLAFHVSNRHLNLEPVLAALAYERQLFGRVGYGPRGRLAVYENVSYWIVLSREMEDLGGLAADSAWWRPRGREDVEAWTDDHSSIFRVFMR